MHWYDNAILGISSAVSAFFGFMFGVPSSTVLAGMLGAFFATRMSDPIGTKKALLIISGGTASGALFASTLINYAGNFTERSAAFTISFCVIYFRKELIDAARRVLTGFKV